MGNKRWKIEGGDSRHGKHMKIQGGRPHETTTAQLKGGTLERPGAETITDSKNGIAHHATNRGEKTFETT